MTEMVVVQLDERKSGRGLKKDVEVAETVEEDDAEHNIDPQSRRVIRRVVC